MNTWKAIIDAAKAHKHDKIATISCSKLDDLSLCPSFQREYPESTAEISPAVRGIALHILMGIPMKDWPLDIPSAELAAATEAKEIDNAIVQEVIRREIPCGGGIYDFGGTPDMEGTTYDGMRIIVDYKFGKKPVHSSTLQLIAYAELCCDRNPCCVAVIQPGQPCDVHNVTKEDHERLIRALVFIRRGERRTGEHCGQCSNRDKCQALGKSLEIVERKSVSGEIIIPDDPEDLGRLMDRCADAEVIVEKLRDAVKAKLVAGQECVGWRLTTVSKKQTPWRDLCEKNLTKELIEQNTNIVEQTQMRRIKR